MISSEFETDKSIFKRPHINTFVHITTTFVPKFAPKILYLNELNYT